MKVRVHATLVRMLSLSSVTLVVTLVERALAFVAGLDPVALLTGLIVEPLPLLRILHRVLATGDHFTAKAPIVRFFRGEVRLVAMVASLLLGNTTRAGIAPLGWRCLPRSAGLVVLAGRVFRLATCGVCSIGGVEKYGMHGGLLPLVDHVCFAEPVPDEPSASLAAATNATQPLNVGALAREVAHYQDGEALCLFTVLVCSVVDATHKVIDGDQEEVLLGEVLQFGQVRLILNDEEVLPILVEESKLIIFTVDELAPAGRMVDELLDADFVDFVQLDFVWES